MKNNVYYLGITACIITTCGCLFKIMHWPGASILLVIGLVMLAVLFLPLAISSIVKAEANKKMRTFYILVAIIMAANFTGALFKIMHWPGAGVLLMICIPLPFAVLLPAYLFANPTDKAVNYRNLMAMMFFFAYFAAITALLSLGVSQNVVDGFTRSVYNIEEKTTALAENTKWMAIRSEKDTVSGNNSIAKNNQITMEADKLCGKIDEIKKMIIINGSGKALQIPGIEKYAGLRGIKYVDIRPTVEMRHLTDLKIGINNYKVLLQKQCSPDSPLYNYLNKAFNTSNGNSEGEPWEYMLLRDKIIVSAIESLDLLQFRVRMAAAEAVSEEP